MAVTATLKFVLREIPASREHDGLVYLALHNVPKGVPARVHLDEAPLLVGCPSKLWRTALQRTQALAASGPPLWIVEAHVGVQRARCWRLRGSRWWPASPQHRRRPKPRGTGRRGGVFLSR